MRSVTYSMGVSLDGYIVGPDGNFGWTMPDEEVFRFVTDQIRQIDVPCWDEVIQDDAVVGDHRPGSIAGSWSASVVPI